jgi:hypothetical protein
MSDSKRRVRPSSDSYVSFTRAGMVVDLERYLRSDRGREFLEQFERAPVSEAGDDESAPLAAGSKEQA